MIFATFFCLVCLSYLLYVHGHCLLMVFFATLYSTVNFCTVQSMLYQRGVGRRGWGINLEPLSHPSDYNERGGLCIDISRGGRWKLISYLESQISEFEPHSVLPRGDVG